MKSNLCHICEEKESLKQKIVRLFCEKKDLIPGGLADNKTLSDIAEHHSGESSGKAYDDMLQLLKDQLEMGIKVEMEHVDSREEAREISLDHLWEDPHYYTKLDTIEEH